MATKKLFLKLEKGNVKSVSESNVVQRTYYNKGDAIRADWYDLDKESVEVYLKSGKILLISNSGVIIKSL